jgi:hypothetical protein
VVTSLNNIFVFVFLVLILAGSCIRILCDCWNIFPLRQAVAFYCEHLATTKAAVSFFCSVIQ